MLPRYMRRTIRILAAAVGPPLDLRSFDYVQFGADLGALPFIQKHLGGERGLIVDHDRAKVATARNQGREAMALDIASLSGADDRVKFVALINYLPYLQNQAECFRCIRAACMLARDFVYIQQPGFDGKRALVRPEDLGVHLRALRLEGAASGFTVWPHPRPNPPDELRCVVRLANVNEVSKLERRVIACSGDSVQVLEGARAYPPEPRP